LSRDVEVDDDLRRQWFETTPSGFEPKGPSGVDPYTLRFPSVIGLLALATVEGRVSFAGA